MGTSAPVRRTYDVPIVTPKPIPEEPLQLPTQEPAPNFWPIHSPTPSEVPVRVKRVVRR